jgi:hypothetical protein
MPSLGSLASALTSVANVRRGEVYLVELDRDDRPLDGKTSSGQTPRDTRRKFQYFPESLTDGKAVNWQPKEIPGGSLPIYQYINSGERTISFTAVFTTDVDHRSFEGVAPAPVGKGFVSSNKETQENQYFAARERLKAAGAWDRNAYIPGALAWLRRFLLPRYGESGQVGVPLTEPPRKLLLVIPGSGIHFNGGLGGFSSEDSMHGIMTQCEIVYEAFFPSGNPRIATAALAFAEIPQSGGRVSFPQVTDQLDTYASTYYSYQPAPRR